MTIYDSTGPQQVTLNGTADGPTFSFNPKPLAFGTVTAGSPKTLLETVTNGGTSPFLVSNIILNGAGYSLSGDNCTNVAVAPGNGCTVNVTLDPSGSGDLSSSMLLLVNSGQFQVSVPITATGVAPAVSATSASFPNTPVGTASAPISVVLSNAGPGSWTVGTLSVGSGSGFSIASDPCSGTIVAAGASCTVGVVFQPTYPEGFSAQLKSSGNYHLFFGSLVGSGVAPVARIATSVDFGSHEVGTSTQLPVQVTNTGSSPLHVTGLTFSPGGDFNLASLGACGSVALGAQCTLSVQFTPSAATSRTETMTLVDDEVTGASAAATVTGTGLAVAPCAWASLSSSPELPAAAGTNVVFTASASPCARPEFQFLAPGGTWTAYSSQQTLSWNTTGVANGTYTVQVRARDTGSSSPFEAAGSMQFRIVTPACASAVVRPDQVGPQSPGAAVTFTASRPGCTDPAIYQFWIVGNGLPWKIVKPYSTSPMWNVDYTKFNGPGTYSIDVWVKEPGSANSYDTFALASFVIGDCTSAAMTPNTGNGSFTVTAAGPGCANAEFKFWMVGNGRSWFVAQDWRGDGTLSMQFDPAAQVSGLTPGTYSLDAWVREAGSSANPSYFRTWALSTVVVPGGTCGGAVMSSTETSPASAGAVIHLNSTGGSCTSPQFEYWLYPGNQGGWQLLRGYSATSAFAWSTAGLREGTYSVVAWVRQGTSSPAVGYDTYSLTSYTLAGCDSATMTADFTSPQPLGRTVTFTTSPHGACAAPVYEYWILPQGGSWILIQPWTANNAFRWENIGAGYNNYAIVVWVKPAGTSPAAGYETYDLVSFALTG